MYYVKILKLLKIFEVAKLVELAKRIRYRQSLLNRLNRAYSADSAEIIRKFTFQICRCAYIKFLNYFKLFNLN